MNWYRVLIIALATTLVSGCGGTGDSVLPDDSDATSESPLAGGDVARVESLQDSEGDNFEPPFSGNTSFFSPPRIRHAESSTDDVRDDAVVENVQHANVRVIGFSQISEAETQALISVEGSLQSVRPGDSVNGVTVVALDAPTVTLQQRNERWTVALFSQPLVNPQVEISAQRQSISEYQNKGRGESNLLNARSSVSGFSFEARNSRDGGGTPFPGGEAGEGVVNNLPPVPASPSNVGVPSEIELPEDLDLPEPPSLPGLEEPFDQELPGINVIPELPSS